MTTQSKASSREESFEQSTSTAPEGGKPMISQAERWLRVREKAYARAQKRGFVGGNPFTDWLEAEKEIDAAYTTDYRGVLSLSVPGEIAEKIKRLLARYGLDHLGVDGLLAKHREGMERLAAVNRSLIASTSELASQQTALVQQALSGAVQTLQSVAQGRMRTDGVARQAELSMKAIENALSHVKALTEAVTRISPAGRKDSSPES